MEVVQSLTDIRIPVWLYRVLAIVPLTGMVGIDHFAIGSNQTGMAKALLNVLTLGAWYVYDALQSLDGPKIVQEGLEIPFYGAAHIGKGRLAEGLTGMGGGANFLNLLFTLVSGALAVFSSVYADAGGTLGSVAKVLQGISIPATVGIGGFSVYNLFKKPKAQAGGGDGVPSLDEVAKMVGGGGGDKEPNTDTFAVGLLIVLAVTGFTLAAVRGSETA